MTETAFPSPLPRRLAIVPVHGIGVIEGKTQARNLATNLTAELHRSGYTAWTAPIHYPADGAHRQSGCLCLKSLPDPVRSIITDSTIIDFQPVEWRDLVRIKPTWALLTWARGFSKRLFGRPKGTGMAKAAAEDMTATLIASALALLMCSLTAVLFAALQQPSINAMIEYALFATAAIAMCEAIVTQFCDHYITKSRPDFFPLRGETDAQKIGETLVRISTRTGLGSNARLFWKWGALFAVAFGAADVMWRFAPGPHPVVISSLAFAAFPIARRALAAASRFVRPLSDIALYADDDVAITNIRDRFAHVVLRLLEMKNDDGSDFYDEVHIVGHSMGSVIAFESFYDAWRLCGQGPLGEEAFSRIRSFTTLGTGLEKMHLYSRADRYFNDEDDIHQRLAFGAEHLVRAESRTAGKIAWNNIYYLWDPVADPVTAHTICTNSRFPTPIVSLLRLDPHRAYFHDAGVASIMLTELGFNVAPRRPGTRFTDRLQRSVHLLTGRVIPTGHIRATLGLTAMFAGLVAVGRAALHEPFLAPCFLLVFLAAMFGLQIILDEKTEPISV